MQQILLVVQILVAVSLIALVLLQQGRGADAGAAFGSGGAGSVFGSRGPASVLARGTAILAVVFFVNSMALAYVAREKSRETRSVVERYEERTQEVPVTPGFDSAPPSEPDASSDVPDMPPS